MPHNDLNLLTNAAPALPPEDALLLLDARRSVSFVQLRAPGPDDASLARMLTSAVRVPDHGKRVPFRFIAIRGEARQAFGNALAERHLKIDAETSPAAIAKDRDRYTYAPLIVVVVARLGPDAKIPVQERLLSAGCTCFALLQAAQAMGFRGCWLTGWAAYDRGVAVLLWLQEDEHVIGFIHLGTAETAPDQDRERPDPALLLSHWAPA